MARQPIALLAIMFYLLTGGCDEKSEWPPNLGKAQSKSWSERTIKEVPHAQRSAKFGAWGTVRAGSGEGIYSSGPCLVEGEILLGENIFTVEKVPDLSAENSFEVIDYGSDYTLIRLDGAKGHHLCVAQGGIDIAGIHLKSTASLPGSRVMVGDGVYEHRRDGWYLGNRLIHKTELLPLK